jgi:hypothetical protein
MSKSRLPSPRMLHLERGCSDCNPEAGRKLLDPRGRRPPSISTSLPPAACLPLSLQVQILSLRKITCLDLEI